MRKARTGSLGPLLPVDVVEPDGLIVTSDGRYVRLIECERMPNAITADDSAQTRIERAFAEICRGIPDRQALAIYAQTDPIPVGEALAEDRRRVRPRVRPRPPPRTRRPGPGQTPAAVCADPVRRPRRRLRTTRGRRPLVAGRPPPTRRTRPQDPLSPRAGSRPGSHRVALSPARGRRQLATDRAGSSPARRGRDRAVAARRRASAGMPVGALPPRRPRAARPGRARRGDRTGGRNHGRGGRPPAPPDSRRHLLGARARGNRRRRSSLATSLRRDARGDPAPRNAADPHHAVVADAPALSAAARHRRGAHPRRKPRPGTRPPTTALEAAVRRDRLQAPPSAADRLRRARSPRRSRTARRRARGRDRRDRLQGLRHRRDPRPARASPKRSTSWSKPRRGNSRPTPALGSSADAGAACRD